MSHTKSHVLDPAGRALLDSMRRQHSAASMSILEYVFAADRPCTISEIVEATGVKRNTVSVFLARASRKGLIEPVTRGIYQRSLSTFRQPGKLSLEADDLLGSEPYPQEDEEASESPQPLKLPQFKLEFEL